MAKPSDQPKPSGESNLLWASVGLILAALIAAVGVYALTSHVLNSFQDTNTMVMLITDAGTKSDDKRLEGNLTTATVGLQACRDLGLALALGCLACGVGVSIRLYRQRAS